MADEKKEKQKTAVALAYDPNEDGAPKVIASGKGALAEKIIEQAEEKQRSVISENSAAELTSMLQTVIQKGTGTHANIGRPAAGKTGTTSDYHDAWFVGYTPDLVAGVWIGNDNNASLHSMTGGQTPAEIWKAFMSKALATTPAKNFDGSAAGKNDAVGELEDDEKTAVKHKPSELKKDIPKEKAEEAPPVKGGQNAPVQNKPEPEPKAEAPKPEPVSDAPERGGGVGKGR